MAPVCAASGHLPTLIVPGQPLQTLGGCLIQLVLLLALSFQVINVEKSFASLLPSKVEIALKKASPITWAGLEQPQSRVEACQPPPQDEATKGSSPEAPLDESDDSLGWSEDEG